MDKLLEEVTADVRKALEDMPDNDGDPGYRWIVTDLGNQSSSRNLLVRCVDRESALYDRAFRIIIQQY